MSLRGRCGVFVLVGLAAAGLGGCADRDVVHAYAEGPSDLRAACGGQQVTTCTLLDDAWSHEAITRTPVPPYRARQASSRDPASVSPDDPAWFSNRDAGNYLRDEERGGRTEHVMMEAAGPGAIVRIWSANPAGVIRIYVDDDETPIVEAPAAELLAGEIAPFLPPYGHVASRGHNLYWPFPFARSARVTVDAERLYYVVQWREYDAGTTLEPTTAAVLTRVGDALRSGAPSTDGAGEAVVETRSSVIEPDGAFVLALEDTGPAAIDRLTVTASMPTAEQLRETELVLSFDGRVTARVPLGDFFGSGPGLNPFETHVASVAAEGRLEARWWMPYREDASVELRNRSAEPLGVELEVSRMPYDFDETSLYFHASYNSTGRVHTSPVVDWTLAHVGGRGQYVGTLLNTANPEETWWGEGDEKIWIDGEPSPRFFGTGTEDYFGYAWYSWERYDNPWHAQTRVDGPRNAGRSSNVRWHLLDAIPFDTELRFDLEIQAWEEHDLVLDGIAFYYADEAGGELAAAPDEGFSIPAVPY